jgi:hypothetical protein
MYVKLINQELAIQLPPELKEHTNVLFNDINQEFGFEPLTNDTIKQMNTYVVNWFAQKGIELPSNTQED